MLLDIPCPAPAYLRFVFLGGCLKTSLNARWNHFSAVYQRRRVLYVWFAGLASSTLCMSVPQEYEKLNFPGSFSPILIV